MNSKRIPAELINELFGSLPLEIAFDLLAKMPDGLLARNVQKMFNGIKEALKNNKLNEEDCGPNLTISEDGLKAKYSGPILGVNSVRAFFPILNLKAINKPIITFYYELEILNGNGFFSIGFCGEQFPLKGIELGWLKNSNSIGIWNKNHICVDGFTTKFENADGYFEKDDLVGLGIIHHPNSKMEYFATLNGILLGKAELPAKLANIQLFPAISFHGYENSIHVNFGKNKWQFEDFKRVLE